MIGKQFFNHKKVQQHYINTGLNNVLEMGIATRAGNLISRQELNLHLKRKNYDCNSTFFACSIYLCYVSKARSTKTAR